MQNSFYVPKMIFKFWPFLVIVLEVHNVVFSCYLPCSDYGQLSTISILYCTMYNIHFALGIQRVFQYPRKEFFNVVFTQVSARQHFGDPISCIVDGVPGGTMDLYCWIHSTFSIPSRYKCLLSL